MGGGTSVGSSSEREPRGLNLLGENVAAAIERGLIGQTQVHQYEGRKRSDRRDSSAEKSVTGCWIAVRRLQKQPSRIMLLDVADPSMVMVVIDHNLIGKALSPSPVLDVDQEGSLVKKSEVEQFVVRRLQQRPTHDAGELTTTR